MIEENILATLTETALFKVSDSQKGVEIRSAADMVHDEMCVLEIMHDLSGHMGQALNDIKRIILRNIAAAVASRLTFAEGQHPRRAHAFTAF